MPARCIAIVGAESTGKSTLAAALVPALRQQLGQRVALVGEVLREWCQNTGRTPRADEQAAIVRMQHERIDAAAAAHEIVVCDTTALMTAVYSRLLFNDGSLEERALALHARMAATLLTALDLPWVADGHQRDGAHVRAPVDALLRALLHRRGLPYAVVTGVGEARLQQALAALEPLWRETPRGSSAAGAAGLFTGLADRTRRGRPDTVQGTGRWWCDCCVPEGERAALAQRRAGI
jgi:nicotinamide riboside kinase